MEVARASFGVCVSIVIVGMLHLPYAFSQTGPWLGSCILIFVAFLSRITLKIFVAIANYKEVYAPTDRAFDPPQNNDDIDSTSKKDNAIHYSNIIDFIEIGTIEIPENFIFASFIRRCLDILHQYLEDVLRIVIAIAEVIFCTLLATSFLMILFTELDSLTSNSNNNNNTECIVIVSIVFISFFISFLKIRSLFLFNIIAVAIVISMVIISFVNWLYTCVTEGLPVSTAEITFFTIINGTFDIFFAYTFQIMFLPIYSNMKNKDEKSVDRTILYSIVGTSFIYLSFALLSYFALGDDLKKNIIESYQFTGLKTFMQILVIAALTLSYPLQIIPGRYAIISIFNLVITKKYPKKYELIDSVEFEFKGFRITVILIGITLVLGYLDLQQFFFDKDVDTGVTIFLSGVIGYIIPIGLGIAFKIHCGDWKCSCCCINRDNEENENESEPLIGGGGEQEG